MQQLNAARLDGTSWVIDVNLIVQQLVRNDCVVVVPKIPDIEVIIPDYVPVELHTDSAIIPGCSSI